MALHIALLLKILQHKQAIIIVVEQEVKALLLHFQRAELTQVRKYALKIWELVLLQLTHKHQLLMGQVMIIL